MLDLPLQDIITAHTDALSAHALEFLPTIRLLLLQGSGPVSPEQLATAMRWTRSEVGAFLRSSGLVVNAEGNIQTVGGSGCALDTILAPMLSGRSTRVASHCPATGKEIRLTATPHGVEGLDPPGAVLSLCLPGPETSAGNAGKTICVYGHFFVDREHASTWPGLHPDAVLLSIADAAHLAREIVNAARRHAERAKIR
jgi:alkylmercury lyase